MADQNDVVLQLKILSEGEGKVSDLARAFLKLQKEMTAAAEAGDSAHLEGQAQQYGQMAEKLQEMGRELAGLRAVGQELTNMGRSGEITNDQLGQLIGSMERIGGSRSAIVQFQALSQQISHTEKKLSEARIQYTKLSESQDSSNKQINKSTAEIARLEKSLIAQSSAQEACRVSLNKYGIAVGNLENLDKELVSSQEKLRLKMLEVAEIGNSRNLLGIRAHAEIRREIQATTNAYNTLKTSGKLSQGELTQAAAKTRSKIAELKDELESASKSSVAFSGVMGKVAGVLAAIGVATGVADLAKSNIELADSWAGMNARLNLVTNSSKELTAAQNELFNIAQRNGSQISDVTSLYVKLAQSLKENNVSQRDMLQLVEMVTQSFRISGATTEEAAAATQQFGQALASGVLRGDEFNSMAEQSPRLMQAMAAGMGVPVSALREMAEQGKLTTSIITAALKSQADTINGEFGRLPMTVGQATTKLSNEWGKLVNEFNQTNHVTENIAKGLGFVTSHLDDLVAIAKVAGIAVVAALGVNAIQTVSAFAGELVAATRAAGGLGAALGKLPLRLAPTVAIAVVGLPVLEAAGKAIGTYAAKWSGVDKEVEKVETSSRIAMLNNLRDVEMRIAAQNEYSAVQVKTADQVARLHAQERAGYAQSLEGALSYQKGLLAQAVIQEQLGQKTEEAQGKAKAAIAALTDALKLAKIDAELFAQAIGADLAAGVALGAAQAISDFNRLTADGKDSGEALKSAFDGVLSSLDVSRVGAFVEAMGRLRTDGKITADEMQQQFSQALSKLDGQQLVAFQIAAAAAFQGASNEAARMATVIDQVNRAALKNLGMDADLVLEGISTKAKSAIGSFEVLAASGTLTGDQLAKAFEAALASADSEKAVEALRVRLEELGKQAVLAKPQMDDLFAKAKQQAEEVTKGINGIEEAFRQLGVQSPAVMKKMAAESKESWELIKNNAQVSLAKKQEAFKRYADQAIAANNGVADSVIEADAKMLGLEVSADSAGKAVVAGMEKAAGATKKVTEEGHAVVAVMGKMESAADKAAESAANAAGKMREAAKETERAASKSAGGFERQAGSLNYVGILNYLKSAGLNDSASARIANEFVDQNGSVPYMENPGQRKYNGSTLTDALGKAVVQEMRSGNSGRSTSSQSTAPASPQLTQSAQPVVINIGGTSHSVNLASRNDVSSLENLLRELSQGAARS